MCGRNWKWQHNGFPFSVFPFSKNVSAYVPGLASGRKHQILHWNKQKRHIAQLWHKQISQEPTKMWYFTSCLMTLKGWTEISCLFLRLFSKSPPCTRGVSRWTRQNLSRMLIKQGAESFPILSAGWLTQMNVKRCVYVCELLSSSSFSSYFLSISLRLVCVCVCVLLDCSFAFRAHYSNLMVSFSNARKQDDRIPSGKKNVESHFMCTHSFRVSCFVFLSFYFSNRFWSSVLFLSFLYFVSFVQSWMNEWKQQPGWNRWVFFFVVG